MTPTLFLAIVFAAASPARGAAPEFDPDVDHYVWSLASLYPNARAWEEERRQILEAASRVARLEQTMARSAADLADALDEISALRTRATKMTIFGELAFNLDARSAEARRQFDVGTALVTSVESAIAFVPTKVIGIGEARVAEWLRAEPRLDRHRPRLMRILREAPYTLAPREQSLVESMARWPHFSADVRDELEEADLGWPVAPGADGKPVRIGTGTLRQLPAESRPDAARALMERLRSLENLYGLLYTRRIDADLTIARHRNFSEGIDAEWFLRDGFPPGSAAVAVSEARRHLPLLHRYLALRARALGRPRNAYADIYLPAPDEGQSFSIADALALAIDASAPLGADYQARLRNRISSGWMHLPPWPQKRGIFEVFPALGGWHPLMLTSFRPSYRGARQITGALTDLMKDGDVPADRQPDSRDDPPVYGNGIIYAGDMLFDDLVRSRASSPRTRIADSIHALDLLWGSFFQPALMAELDAKVQRLVIDGKPPDGAAISKLYRELLGEYAGPAAVEEGFGAEWMTYAVTFYSYEHQFWAAAVAAGAAIVEKIRAGDADGVRAVTGIFGRGDSDRSYLLLRGVGIDLASTEGYAPLFRRMESLVRALEGDLAVPESP